MSEMVFETFELFIKQFLGFDSFYHICGKIQHVLIICETNLWHTRNHAKESLLLRTLEILVRIFSHFYKGDNFCVLLVSFPAHLAPFEKGFYYTLKGKHALPFQKGAKTIMKELLALKVYSCHLKIVYYAAEE